MTEVANQFVAPTIPGPDPHTKTPSLRLPAGACDCHAHVIGPQSKYRYASKRRYTPPDAPLADYLSMLRAIGVARAVLIQPSVYATDNSAMLDALQASKSSLRGIAIVNDSISDAELSRMHELGVRGLRLNLRFVKDAITDVAPRVAARVAPLGWHLQIRIHSADFIQLEPLLEKLPLDIVIDHIGQVPPQAGTDGKDFQALLRLVKTGRCWVKLSAPMRMSDRDFPYSDVTPFARALVEAASDRMVWATDWPHTKITKMPNDGDLVDLLSDWIPDAATRKKVLVDNPARLYGFY